jgi:hypothetical protein
MMRRSLQITALNLVARAAQLIYFVMLGNVFGVNSGTDTVFF